MIRHLISIAAVFWLLTGTPASAQDPFGRTVGPNAFDKPLEFRAFTTHDLGAFALAAGVPIGIDALPLAPDDQSRPAVVLTGRTVRAAVAAMIALDRRYRVREEEGVILFEPADGASGMAQAEVIHPLDAAAPAVHLRDTTAREAFGIAAALLGAPPSAPIPVSDTKPFGLDAPAGTIRSLLNAIVRSHGRLVWIFERTPGKSAMFPYNLMFMSGLHGAGVGLSGRRSEEDLDPRRFVRTRADEPSADIAGAIVQRRQNGSEVVVTGMWPSVALDLSAAARVTIGMEMAPGPPPKDLLHLPEVAATGRTLREVLDALVARDTRYEWRVVDGTIVIRPVSAWTASDNPLYAVVPDVDLHDVTMTEAVRAVITALGGLDQRYTTFPDSRTVSVSVAHGTALDLVTALVKSHGSLTWTLEDAAPDEIQMTGRRHRLTFGVRGGSGLGNLVR